MSKVRRVNSPAMLIIGITWPSYVNEDLNWSLLWPQFASAHLLPLCRWDPLYLTWYNRVKYYNHVAHTELYVSLCLTFELCACNIGPIERKKYNRTEHDFYLFKLVHKLHRLTKHIFYNDTVYDMWVRYYPLYSGKHVYSVIHVCDVTYTCTKSDIYITHSGVLG